MNSLLVYLSTKTDYDPFQKMTHCHESPMQYLWHALVKRNTAALSNLLGGMGNRISIPFSMGSTLEINISNVAIHF